MMRLFLLSLFLLPALAWGQSVGINTSSPNPNAALDVQSTTQGFLPPRMTTAQRDAIASPPEGLVIWNLETHCLEAYNGAIWISYCGGYTTPPFDFTMAVSPTCMLVTSAASGTASVTLTLASGISQAVTLSASGLPANASASFSPAAPGPTATSTLTITTTGAAVGTYSVTITGTAGALVKNTSISLQVVNSVPAGITNLVGWWDASQASTLSLDGSNGVQTWTSAAGSASVAQGTASLRPLYTGSMAALGGQPALYFDGSNDYLTGANLLNSKTAESTFLVLIPTSTAVNFVMEQNPSLSSYSFENCGGMSLSHYINNTGGASNTLTTSTSYYLSYVSGAGTMEAWRNGSSQGTRTFSGNTGTGPLFMGGRTSGACVSYFQGYIAEILVYDRALGTCERQAVEAYLKAKYGL